MTTETAPLESILPARAAAWRRALGGFFLVLAALVLFTVAFVAGLAVAYQGRALPGVSVAGIDLSGLDRTAAAAKLRLDLPALSGGQLTLRVEGDSRTIPYAAIGRDYDVTSMLDAAFDVGRSGSPLERATDELRSLFRGSQVTPVATYDRAALTAVVAAVADALQRPATNATVSLPKGAVHFAVTAAQSGRQVDQAAALAALDAQLTLPDPGSMTIELAVATVQPAITTDQADAAARAADGLAAQDLTLTAADQSLSIPASTVRGWITFQPAPQGAGLQPTFDTERVGASLSSLAASVAQAPKNAGFVFSNGRISGVTPAVEGRALDVPGSAALIAQALGGLSPSQSTPAIALKVNVTQPTLTTAQAQAVAPKMKMVSSWSTIYYPGISNFYGRNIQIPANQINGTVVAPGQWFDFWKSIDLSRAAGFGPGGAIINGHTEETGALGGGICSTSTTLFNAALRYGLQMGARMNHYYYITRYPLGLDATVFESSGGFVQTMSFRNDTPYPIYIRGVNTYNSAVGHVTFQLWSVPDGRKVVISAPTVKNRTYASDTVQYTTSLAPGVRERVEWPANGMDVWVTRTVYDPNGTVVHKETYYSHYARITGLTLIGASAPSPSPTP